MTLQVDVIRGYLKVRKTSVTPAVAVIRPMTTQAVALVMNEVGT